MDPGGGGGAGATAANLPVDMLANIHGRLSLLDRLTFAAAFRSSRGLFRPEAPCLVVPADLWSLGPSPDGVEDAVHHEGRFYSITCSGKMEEWRQQDADTMFASTVVEPALRLTPADTNNCKYLVVTPGGRLMVVLKTKETTGLRTPLSFKVQVLGAGAKEWKETDDIGDAALFVGTKGSLCVSTREHPELRAGCVYYAAHGGVVVLSLKGGTVKEVDRLWTDHSWLEWFTPCISR
ncbi:hypothetical protein CFC21_026858 [Triticum aestivum]|uniref:KIB1-4 beta-propeller domain-containing protein n=2 Tax=Triticum aestivum TaxID=4565 RepID=A0A9R1EM12_WHEAT|nr:hypothetical protein CFC21_026858 [Triticum aestivum]CDM86185.1 unnamed protein product [Triticum aestivum]